MSCMIHRYSVSTAILLVCESVTDIAGSGYWLVWVIVSESGVKCRGIVLTLLVCYHESLSVSVSFGISLSLGLCVSLHLSLSRSVSVFLCVSLSESISLLASLSPFVCVSFSIYISLSVSLSLFLFLCLFLYLPSSISKSLSHSLSLTAMSLWLQVFSGSASCFSLCFFVWLTASWFRPASSRMSTGSRSKSPTGWSSDILLTSR